MRYQIRRAAAMILAGAVLCGAAGCSSGGTKRQKNNYPAGSLVGEWTDYNFDAVLGEDGSISVERDLSELLYYMPDGTLMADGYELPAANTKSDNGTLTVTGDITDSGDDSTVLLEMKRVGDTAAENPEIFDGIYEITGGTLKERIADEYAGGSESTLDIVLDRGSCEMRIENVGSYTQKGDELTLTGDKLTEAGYSPERTAGLYFVLENDGATLHFADGTVETFKKIG